MERHAQLYCIHRCVETEAPNGTTCISLFLKVLRQCYLTMRMQKAGSEFCDTWKKLRNNIVAARDAEKKRNLRIARQ